MKGSYNSMGAFQAGPIQRVQELSQGEMAILGYLILSDDEVTPTDLSRRLQLSSARIANALNSMENKKYVVRTHDSVDRRKVYVAITELGAEKANHAKNQAIAGLKELLQELGEYAVRQGGSVTAGLSA